jgi:hypothetical protein
MMPQPPQQRPARMPSGPSPTMGGGMPNRPDMLRQQAEQTLPSMPPRPPMGGGRPPMGGGAPAGGIAALMGGGPRPPMGPRSDGLRLECLRWVVECLRWVTSLWLKMVPANKILLLVSQ